VNQIFEWNISQYGSIHYAHSYSVMEESNMTHRSDIPVKIFDNANNIIVELGHLQKYKIETTTLKSEILSMEEIKRSNICPGDTLPHMVTLKILEGELYKNRISAMIVYTCQVFLFNKSYKIQHGVLILATKSVEDDSRIFMELLKYDHDVIDLPGNKSFCSCQEMENSLEACRPQMSNRKSAQNQALLLAFSFFGGFLILFKFLNAICKLLIIREHRDIVPEQISVRLNY
jgi:hypothetical protein